MDRLAGKVAIVTGSTSGIGIGIAKAYAAEGAHVIICGRRQEKGQGVVDEIVAAGGPSVEDGVITGSMNYLVAGGEAA